MKKHVTITAALALAAALAGCTDKATTAMVAQCTSDGYDKGTCECLVRASKKTMDKDAFTAMGLVAQGKEAEADALMEKMPIEKKFSVATGIVGAMSACSVHPK